MKLTAESIETVIEEVNAAFARARSSRVRSRPFHVEFSTDFGAVSVLQYPSCRCEVQAPLSLLMTGEQDKANGGYRVIAYPTKGAIVDGKYDPNAEGEVRFARTFRTIDEARLFVLAALRERVR